MQTDDPKSRLRRKLDAMSGEVQRSLAEQDVEEMNRHRDKFGNQWQYY